MADSAGEVEASKVMLGEFRDQLRERYGLAAAQKLTDMIDGTSGKKMIRYTLLNLVDAGRVGNPNRSDIQDTAQQALQLIGQLNSQLIELHDLILLPHKAS